MDTLDCEACGVDGTLNGDDVGVVTFELLPEAVSGNGHSSLSLSTAEWEAALPVLV